VPNCVIALDLRSIPKSFQLSPEGIDRELGKFTAGLSFHGAKYGPPPHVDQRVLTGNWDWGVFRGNAELRFVVQWIAFSLITMGSFTNKHTDIMMNREGKKKKPWRERRNRGFFF
jgi:hypothetical protein